MRKGKRLPLLGALAAGLLACEQDVTTPGACPDFCPGGVIQLVDTTLTGVLERDTSFAGYVVSTVAPAMQIVGGGATVESRGLLWFSRFTDSAAVDSIRFGRVVRQDSFRLDLVLVDRSPGVADVEVTVHRIAPSIDRLGDFAELDPFFEDSTIVGVVAIPDDAAAADTVSAVIPVAAFPTFEADSQQIALGLSIRGGTPAFAGFRTRERALGALLTRYVLVESGSDSLERTDFRLPEFDGFVHTDLPSPTAGSLVVGGTPSSRTFIRINLPEVIIDESDIVRAHLLLVPVEPVPGAPSDTLQVVAEALGADFGAKSPILPVDDTLLVNSPVGVGSTDTVSIDISFIVSVWQADSTRVRTLVLRAREEAASVAEFRFGSTRHLGLQPAIRITYVPPFSFGQ